MKILLCGYHDIGFDVLSILNVKYGPKDIALCTHTPHMEGIPNLDRVAKDFGIWSTTESVNTARLPFRPDIIASVYYRNIIKDNVIDMVNGRIFNVHPSLLPKYRGCSSVPWAIIEGEQYTGVTFHYIDGGIDTGNILLQAAIPIGEKETQASLFSKCMITGGDYWEHAFELVKAGVRGVPQRGESSYYKREVPYDGEIDDTLPRDKIERFIRAMTFPPYPYAKYKGKEIKTFEEFKEIYD